MDPPKSPADWAKILRARFDRKHRELGLATKHALEVFTVSAWGEVPSPDDLLADLPVFCAESSNLERLKSRLNAWRGEGYS